MGVKQVENAQAVVCLHHVRLTGMVRFGPHFILALAPSPQVVANADGTHAGQRGIAFLQVCIVTTAVEMAVGTDNQRILTGFPFSIRIKFAFFP